MLNKKLFSIFSLSILLGLGCLVSCGGNDGDKTTPTPTTPTPEPKDTYEVSFYVDGNLYGETLTVNAGEKITKPQTQHVKPTKTILTLLLVGMKMELKLLGILIPMLSTKISIYSQNLMKSQERMI